MSNSSRALIAARNLFFTSDCYVLNAVTSVSGAFQRTVHGSGAQWVRNTTRSKFCHSRISFQRYLHIELDIPIVEVEELLTHRRSVSAATGGASGTPGGPAAQMTQSAAAMIQSSQTVATGCEALDKVLEGGLSRGQTLEISGPPGSPKEKLAMSVVSAFVEAGEGVIFVDCQHMTSASTLRQLFEAGELQKLVHYTSIQDLAEFLLLMYQLPCILHSHSNVALLVINSISFPFQAPTLSLSQKNSHLEKVKQALSRASASHNLTTVVTSQLATKMINADGSPGTFDSGARGVMMPQLGPTCLLNGKAHRVIISLDGLTSGHIKLLSSPKYPLGKVPLSQEPYSILDDNIV